MVQDCGEITCYSILYGDGIPQLGNKSVWLVRLEKLAHQTGRGYPFHIRSVNFPNEILDAEVVDCDKQPLSQNALFGRFEEGILSLCAKILMLRKAQFLPLMIPDWDLSAWTMTLPCLIRLPNLRTLAEVMGNVFKVCFLRSSRTRSILEWHDIVL
jgi:hypothetical protein